MRQVSLLSVIIIPVSIESTAVEIVSNIEWRSADSDSNDFTLSFV